MRKRCTNPKNVKFPTYGGRGIRVCERWLNSFPNFLADMGERPTGKTLDRHPNNDGNYEPTNCRWATAKEQRANQRSVPEMNRSKHESTVAIRPYVDSRDPADAKSYEDKLAAELATEGDRENARDSNAEILHAMADMLEPVNPEIADALRPDEELPCFLKRQAE
jgi:hypothetical protein